MSNNLTPKRTFVKLLRDKSDEKLEGEPRHVDRLGQLEQGEHLALLILKL